MRVIILAAGSGSRLAPLTWYQPKGLIKIGGIPLLWHTLSELRDAGASEVIVVCGYRGQQLRRTLSRCPRRPPLIFITNQRYWETNSMSSLWLTREWWNTSFCLLDGDLLVSRRLLERLFGQPGDLVAFDPEKRNCVTEMRVQEVGGIVLRIAKSISPQQTSGEFFGVSRWTCRGATEMSRVISERLAIGGAMDWYAEAVCDVAQRIPLGAVRTEQFDWAEVDSIDDIAHAAELVHRWRTQDQDRNGTTGALGQE